MSQPVFVLSETAASYLIISFADAVRSENSNSNNNEIVIKITTNSILR